jgi:hypothetical protein
MAAIAEPTFEPLAVMKAKAPKAPGTVGWAVETVIQPPVVRSHLARFKRRGASDDELFDLMRGMGGLNGWFMTYAPGRGNQPGYAVDWDFSGETPRMWITKHPFVGEGGYENLVGPLRKGKPTLEGPRLAAAIREHFGIKTRLTLEEKRERAIRKRQRGFATVPFGNEKGGSIEKLRDKGAIIWDNFKLLMRMGPQGLRGLGGLWPDWLKREMRADPDMPQSILGEIFTRQPIREPMPDVDTGARVFWLLSQLPRGKKGDIGSTLKKLWAGLAADPEAQFTEWITGPHDRALRRTGLWTRAFSNALYHPEKGIFSLLRTEFGKGTEAYREANRRIFTALEYKAIKARFGEEYLKKHRYVHPDELKGSEIRAYRVARTIYDAFRRRFDRHYPKPQAKEGEDPTGKPNDRRMWGLWDYVTHVFRIETQFQDPHAARRGRHPVVKQLADPYNLPKHKFWEFEEMRTWQEGYIPDIEVALNRYIPGAIMKLTMEEAWSTMKPRLYGRITHKKSSYAIGNDFDNGIILPMGERGSTVLVRFSEVAEGKKRPTRGPWRSMVIQRWDGESRTLHLRDELGKIHSIDPRRIDRAPEGDKTYRQKFPKVYIAYRDRGLIQFLARKQWRYRLQALEKWLRDITEPQSMPRLARWTQMAASYLYEAHLGRMSARPALTNLMQNLLTVQDIGVTNWVQAWEALTVGLPKYGIPKSTAKLKGRILGKEVEVPGINSVAVAIVRKALGKDFAWGILTEAAHLHQTSKDFQLDPNAGTTWSRATKPARDTMMLMWRASEGLNRVLAVLGGYIDAMKSGGIRERAALKREGFGRQLMELERDLESVQALLAEKPGNKKLLARQGALGRKIESTKEAIKKTQFEAYESAVQWGRLVTRRGQGLYERHTSPEYFRTHYDDFALWQSLKIAVRQYMRYPTVYTNLQFGFAQDFWLKAKGEAMRGMKLEAPELPKNVPIVRAIEEVLGFGERIPLPPPGETKEFRAADFETKREWRMKWRELTDKQKRTIESFYRRLRTYQDKFEVIRHQQAWRGRNPHRMMRSIVTTLLAIYLAKKMGLDWGHGVIVEGPARIFDAIKGYRKWGWTGAASAVAPAMIRIAADAARIPITAWAHHDATKGNLPTYYAWVDQAWNVMGNNVLGAQWKKFIDMEVFSKELPQFHPMWTPEKPIGVFSPATIWHPGMRTFPRFPTAKGEQLKSMLLPGRSLERGEYQEAVREMRLVAEQTIMVREAMERTIMDYMWHMSRGNYKEAKVLAQGLDATQRVTGEGLTPPAMQQRIKAAARTRIYNRVMTGTVTQRARNLLVVLRRRADEPTLMPWQEVVAAINEIFRSRRAALIPREVLQELQRLVAEQTPKDVGKIAPSR